MGAGPASPRAPDDAAWPAENPFATKYVRPGALQFVFPPGENLERLVQRLRGQGGWGQIVGPHGAGKSTLLATLLRALAATGCRVQLWELHNGQRRLPEPAANVWARAPFDQALVDGYEQLGWWDRWRLTRFCRRRGVGLLVTTHRSAGLPDLYRVTASLPQTQAVVEVLLRDRPATLDERTLSAAFARHQGDIRELFMELYDRYEAQRPREAP